MDVGKYGEGPTCDLNKLLQQQKDGGCVSAGKTRERSVPVSAQKAHLKEQARVPEEEEQVDPDWGDDQADASGPYDPPRGNTQLSTVHCFFLYRTVLTLISFFYFNSLFCQQKAFVTLFVQ